MELTENRDSKKTETRHITWTLTALDGQIDPKTYEKLKTEIEWSEIGDDGSMTFKSSDAEKMSAFSKKIRTIFAENEDNIVEAFSFSISSLR